MHLMSSTFGQGHCGGASTQTRVSGQRYAEQGTGSKERMSGVSCANRQRLTGISLCSPVVGTRGSLSLLSSRVFALEHLLKEVAKLCGRELTEQQNSEGREILGHDLRTPG